MSNNRLNMLLVEDDSRFRQTMQKAFGGIYRIINAVNTNTAILAAKNNKIDLIILDLSLDDSGKLDGLDLIQPLKTYSKNTPIIVVTKEMGSQTVVKALSLGADDFIRKDEFDAENMKLIFESHVIKRAADTRSDDKTQKKKSNVDGFIGESLKIKDLKKYLILLSRKPEVTVLLTGESGVGKEVAARYLHQFGVRQHQPFEAVHLSAITKTLLESTLFGHKKGSFTDAKKDSKGAFENANGGILFLDEIGEIDANTQIKLLRFLEDKTITPVGGGNLKLDVQIVAATNRNLESEVEKGNFRLDLYHRISQFPLEVPSLRERREDIPLLINHYLQSEGLSKSDFTEIAWQKLLDYHWPGNIRELVNTLKSLCIKKEIMEVVQIDETMFSTTMIKEEIRVPDKGNNNNIHDLHLMAAVAELKQIEKALLEYKGSKGKTAAKFNLSLDNLRYKINKYFEQYPNAFEQFPEISRKYKLN